MIDYDAVIQDYIDQHYDQFEDEYYSQYMIFETYFSCCSYYSLEAVNTFLKAKSFCIYKLDTQ